MLAWTWSDSGGGPRYYLQERSAGATTQDQLDAAATCSASETGCDATAFSIVTLSDGRSALLVQAPDVASLVWVEEGVELTLVGPGATFTPAIAEGLAAEI